MSSPGQGPAAPHVCEIVFHGERDVGPARSLVLRTQELACCEGAGQGRLPVPMGKGESRTCTEVLSKQLRHRRGAQQTSVHPSVQSSQSQKPGTATHNFPTPVLCFALAPGTFGRLPLPAGGPGVLVAPPTEARCSFRVQHRPARGPGSTQQPHCSLGPTSTKFPLGNGLFQEKLDFRNKTRPG